MADLVLAAGGRSPVFSLSANPQQYVYAVAPPSSLLVAGSGSFNPNYPRLAAGRLQASFGASALQYNSAFSTWAAARCIVLLGLNYNGGAASGPGFPGSNRDAYAQSLKANTKVPGGCWVLQYTEPSQIITTSAWPGYSAYMNAQNWPQYIAGTSGSLAMNGSYNFPNQSTYVPLDSAGHIASEYTAEYMLDNLVLGSGPYHSFSTTLDAAPHCDGIYWDDTWYSPIVNCDVNRDGATDSVQSVIANNGTAIQNIAEQWRAGIKRRFARIDALWPNNVHAANAWGPAYVLEFGGSSGISAALANPQQWAGSFWQLFDTGEIQFFFGWGFIEGIYNFQTLMNTYQLGMAIMRGPKIVNLDCGVQNNGTTSNGALRADGSGPLTWSGASPATYTAAYVYMRYITAFTLMGSGALSCDTPGNTDTGLLTFDEWGDNTAQYPPGYLGQPVQPVQTAAAYGNGIWERRFYNSVSNQYFRAVMNPRGNGAQTYNPGVTLYKMRGVQNPSYNNAASFTTLSMADPDGGIFCESPQ